MEGTLIHYIKQKVSVMFRKVTLVIVREKTGRCRVDFLTCNVSDISTCVFVKGLV